MNFYLVIAISVTMHFVVDMAGPFVAEVVWHRGQLMRMSERLRAMSFGCLYAIFAAFLAMALDDVIKTLTPPRMFTMPGWAGLIFAVVMYEFFYYWLHRAQHTIPFLWKFHSVHHAIEKMGAGSGYQHIIEPGLELFCITLPASLFIGGPEGALLAAVLAHRGAYIHSTTRFHLGPLNRVIVDNRMHRIHHSREPRHFDRNFGVITPVWDMLFRTAYFPKADEWPDTGIEGHEEVRSLRAYLLADTAIRPPASVRESEAAGCPDAMQSPC